MDNSISIDIKPQNKINNDEFLNNTIQKCDLNNKSFDYFNALEENREKNKEENREDKKDNIIMNFLARILKNSSKLAHSPWVGPSIQPDI